MKADAVLKVKVCHHHHFIIILVIIVVITMFNSDSNITIIIIIIIITRLVILINAKCHCHDYQNYSTYRGLSSSLLVVKVLLVTVLVVL